MMLHSYRTARGNVKIELPAQYKTTVTPSDLFFSLVFLLLPKINPNGRESENDGSDIKLIAPIRDFLCHLINPHADPSRSYVSQYM